MPAEILTFDDLKKALNMLPEVDTDWILVSPQGVTYKGTPEQLLCVLAKEHPTMKSFSVSLMPRMDIDV